MEQNTQVAEPRAVEAFTSSLTTISIRVITPPADGGLTINGRISGIGKGTAGTPLWPVTVALTYYYQSQPIAAANLGTYFLPVPPTQLTLTNPNVYSPVSYWNVIAPYVVTDFTVLGTSVGVVPPVTSAITPMIWLDGDAPE